MFYVVKDFLSKQPIRPRWCMGCLLFGLTLSACTRRGLTYVQLTNLIANNECAFAGVAASPMLIVIHDGARTSVVRYPDSATVYYADTSLFQLGSMTTLFFVPKFLQQLEEAGLTLDSVALVAGRRSGGSGRSVTYGDLLLHHSGLPNYSPDQSLAGQVQLEALLEVVAIEAGAGASKTAEANFRFDHWNYALAMFALQQRAPQQAAGFRDSRLVYVDEATDAVRQQLASSEARAGVVPVNKLATELFVYSTGGMASAAIFSELLDSLSRVDLARLPAKPTTRARPGTFISLGWYRQSVGQEQVVYTNAGRTRRHGVAVVYCPATDTGVAVLIGDSKPADCLALDILRNINYNWKRTAAHE